MTQDEARDQIITAARFSAWYWATQVGDEKPVSERISGAIFTFLAELDGTGNAPACDVVVMETGDDGNAIRDGAARVPLQGRLGSDGVAVLNQPGGAALARFP